MTQTTTAAVLSVGTELTEGSIQDTHGKYLAEAVRPLGLRVVTIVQIPDNREQFRSELSRLVREARVVFVTGGLGPTSDDLTREVVAETASVGLSFHVDLWQELLKRFSGRPVSETNRKQAFIPDGFGIIANPYGTAPGFWGRVAAPRSGSREGTLLIALPGPPRELRPLVAEFVIGMLQRELGVTLPDEYRATAFLVPESRLEEVLRNRKAEGVEWGTRAEPYRVVFILRGGTDADRERVFEAVRAEIGSIRIRAGECDAAALLLAALRERKLTIAAAESCTGGLIGSLLTDIPGASENVWGSLVVYSNDAKTVVAGVPETTIKSHGAVSRETVAALAEGVLRVSKADVGVSVSGIAGPGGGTPEKPVGTVWIGVRTRGGVSLERHFLFSGARDAIRRRCAVAALLMCEAIVQNGVVDSDALWQYI